MEVLGGRGTKQKQITAGQAGEPLDRFKRFLAWNRLEETSSRLIVAGTLFGAAGPLTAHELFKKVQPKAPRMAISTVYRTLLLLVRSGLATRRDYLGEARYLAEVWPLPMAELVCRSCRRIVVVPGDELTSIAEHAATRHGFRIVSQQFHI